MLICWKATKVTWARISERYRPSTWGSALSAQGFNRLSESFFIHSRFPCRFLYQNTLYFRLQFMASSSSSLNDAESPTAKSRRLQGIVITYYITTKISAVNPRITHSAGNYIGTKYYNHLWMHISQFHKGLGYLLNGCNDLNSSLGISGAPRKSQLHRRGIYY